MINKSLEERMPIVPAVKERLVYDDFQELKQFYMMGYFNALNHNKQNAIDYYQKKLMVCLQWCIAYDNRKR